MATQYLRIANKGETQVEAFTVLGASSARGDSDKIGQFGSGAKHGILCLLRAGLQLIIMCGKEKIVPQCQPQTIHGKVQERVCFRIGNRLETSSMVLDFGAIDWKEPVAMALREFVSNALDSVNGIWNDVVIEYVDKPRAKAGWTSVFIEVNYEVREYVSNLHHKFLHIRNEQDKTLLAQNPGPCKFYRKGVFVHEVELANSLYSYNCGDDLPIDESRNLDSSRVRKFAAELLSKDYAATKHVLKLCCEGTNGFYEREFSNWYIEYEHLQPAMVELYGEDVCVTENAVTFSRAQGKGLNVQLMKGCSGWFSAVTSAGVPDAISKLCKADADGLAVFQASDTLRSNVELVWSKLVECNLTGSLPKPPCFEFEKPMSHGTQLDGYYDRAERAIYIRRDCVTHISTIIEELSHYITSAADETRDLQDFAFRFAGLLLLQGKG